jgi:peptidoglycan/LPS O-acetylase OafA/YrhL
MTRPDPHGDGPVVRFAIGVLVVVSVAACVAAVVAPDVIGWQAMVAAVMSLAGAAALYIVDGIERRNNDGQVQS